MLNDKLGSYLPVELVEDVFKQLVSSVDDDCDKELLESCYTWAETQSPATYTLTVSECCRSNSGEITEVICTKCRQKLAMVEQLLKKHMAEDDRQKYLKSGKI